MTLFFGEYSGQQPFIAFFLHDLHMCRRFTRAISRYSGFQSGLFLASLNGTIKFSLKKFPSYSSNLQLSKASKTSSRDCLLNVRGLLRVGSSYPSNFRSVTSLITNEIKKTCQLFIRCFSSTGHADEYLSSGIGCHGEHAVGNKRPFCFYENSKSAV